MTRSEFDAKLREAMRHFENGAIALVELRNSQGLPFMGDKNSEALLLAGMQGQVDYYRAQRDYADANPDKFAAVYVAGAELNED